MTAILTSFSLYHFVCLFLSWVYSLLQLLSFAIKFSFAPFFPLYFKFRFFFPEFIFAHFSTLIFLFFFVIHFFFLHFLSTCRLYSLLAVSVSLGKPRMTAICLNLLLFTLPVEYVIWSGRRSPGVVITTYWCLHTLIICQSHISFCSTFALTQQWFCWRCCCFDTAAAAVLVKESQ